VLSEVVLMMNNSLIHELTNWSQNVRRWTSWFALWTLTFATDWIDGRSINALMDLLWFSSRLV